MLNGRKLRIVCGKVPLKMISDPWKIDFPENLDYLASMLDEQPNLWLDFSTRVDELGRQPYRAREFFLRYADRILFGVDMPVSREVYRFHFRFLETFDESFDPPFYDGKFSPPRWRVHGIGLPDEVLKKVYFENAIRLIPALKSRLSAFRAIAE